MVDSGRFTLTGVSVRHNKGTGILVGRGARDYAITGCRVHNNGIGADLAGDHAIVSSSLFSDNGDHFKDRIGPNKQLLGNLFSAK